MYIYIGGGILVKKVLHLIAITLVGFYFLYGLTNMFLNSKGYEGADYLVSIILLVLIVLFEGFLIKLYKRAYSAEAIEARKQREAAKKKHKSLKSALAIIDCRPMITNFVNIVGLSLNKHNIIECTVIICHSNR